MESDAAGWELDGAPSVAGSSAYSSEGSLDTSTNVLLAVECISAKSLKVSLVCIVTRTFSVSHIVLTHLVYTAEVSDMSLLPTLDQPWSVHAVHSSGIQTTTCLRPCPPHKPCLHSCGRHMPGNSLCGFAVFGVQGAQGVGRTTGMVCSSTLCS